MADVMLKIFQHTYNDIISLENLLKAWEEFVRDKRSRRDVQIFGRNLMRNIIELHRELAAKTYSHSKYQVFKISDPKPRVIHKAGVRDRLLHHAFHRLLSPFIIKAFASDSHSSQVNKGTHRANGRFKRFINIISKNNTRAAWILKCDIKKFFANIDQATMLAIMVKYIPDKDILWLLSVIVGSFNSGILGKGLPLGNLTSQLLVNIYMNEFDQFVKHKLRVKNYIRYADDFAVISHDRAYLERILTLMQDFLRDRLKLSMHPNKISIRTVASGVDFLGWIHFADHRVLRTATKRRMLKRVKANQGKHETVQSYLGLLKHGNGKKLSRRLKMEIAPQTC